jgi:hypothetical protein
MMFICYLEIQLLLVDVVRCMLLSDENRVQCVSGLTGLAYLLADLAVDELDGLGERVGQLGTDHQASNSS